MTNPTHMNSHQDLLLRQRIGSLKTLGLITGPTAIACLPTEEDIERQIENATAPEEVDGVGHRYLLHKQSYYENSKDEESLDGCDTLEQVEQEIIEYVTQEKGREYGFFVDVYDLDTWKKLTWSLSYTIKWEVGK